MHILVLYQYFQSPDAAGTGRHYSFVKSWAANHDVTVIASSSGFTKPITTQYPPAPPGVRLETIPIRYANRMGVARRFIAYRQFARSSVALGKRIRRPDVIFGTSTPLTVAAAARKLARYWQVPWIFEVRDLWPDFPIQMGAIPWRWFQNRLRAWESGLYRDADRVITLSPDMESHVLARSDGQARVMTLLNGTSFDLVDAADREAPKRLRVEHRLGTRKVVLYAGSLGRANGIPTILEAAERLQDRSDIVFVFIGSGYYGEAVGRAAAEKTNIVALPPVPKHRVFDWHHLADLALVTFLDLPALAANSPSKFFDSLACATPVLVTNPGWTRRFVKDQQCGWSIESLEPDALVDAIERALSDPYELVARGRNGEQTARSLFDRQKMADQLESMMVSLASEKPS